MNWGLIAWFAGVIATLIGIKFIWTIFRTMFSKESMVKVIDGVGSGATKAANRMSENLAHSIQEAKFKHQEKKEQKREQNKPVVYDR